MVAIRARATLLLVFALFSCDRIQSEFGRLFGSDSGSAESKKSADSAGGPIPASEAFSNRSDVFKAPEDCPLKAHGKAAEYAWRWNKLFESSENISATDFLVILNQFREYYGYPIEVWPGGQPGKFSHPVDRMAGAPGPCGDENVVFLKTLRESPSIVYERVHEMDDAGRIIRTWQVPSNSFLLGIQGDEVLYPALAVPFCKERDRVGAVLAIRPDGSFRVIAGREDAKRASFGACDKGTLMADSAYAVCLILHDPWSGQRRKLVFQEPCA